MAHAAFNGVPSLISIFFPLAEVNTVMCRQLLLDLCTTLFLFDNARKAFVVDPTRMMAHSSVVIRDIFNMIWFLYWIIIMACWREQSLVVPSE